MSTLANTNWLISHMTVGGGPVVSVHTEFLSGTEAKYGPYPATYEQDGDSFQLTVPQRDGFLHAIEFTGVVSGGRGSGTASQEPSPPGRDFPFTMHQLS